MVIENYMKYGMLISISGDEFRRDDLQYGLLLYCLIPLHLFVGYLIELIAAKRARGARVQNEKRDNKDPKLRAAWAIIALAHTINATANVGLASGIVYYKIYHPLIGTLCQFHSGASSLQSLSDGSSYLPAVI